MFAWLGTLFSRLTPKRSSPQEERLIFHYLDRENGRRNVKRSVDPIEVERILIDDIGKDWRQQLVANGKPVPAGVIGEDVDKLHGDRRAFEDKLLACIDRAFGVVSYRDGDGLTIVERKGLLEAFLRYCTDLIRLARPFANAQSRASPTPESPQPASPSASTSPAETSDLPEKSSKPQPSPELSSK